MRELVYPVTEFIHGLLNLTQLASYVPFHLHILKLLIHLESNTALNVPIFGFIKIIFLNKHFKMKNKNTQKKMYDLEVKIKITKEEM